MSPLEQAVMRVQARKAAAGVPQAEVAAVTGEFVTSSDTRGPFSGTDLTPEEAFKLATEVVDVVCATVLVTHGPVEALRTMFVEGLLIGIEHGKGVA